MNKKEKLKIFFAYLLISFLIGGIFYKVVYSSDAYNIIGNGLEEYNAFALGNMRPLQYVITNVFIYFLGSNVKYEIIYMIYLSISLTLLAVSMFLVYSYVINIINKNEKIPRLTKLKRKLIFACIIFMFFNRYLSDNLVYLENLTMVLSLFLSVVASILYSKNIKYKNIIVLALLILSEFSYQTMITAFVVFSLLFYALKNNNKIDIKYLVKLSILFIIPLLLLFGFSKIDINGIQVNDRYFTKDEIVNVILAIIVQVFIYVIKYMLYYIVLSTIFRFTDINKENKYIKYNLMFILVVSVIYTYSFGLINKAFMSNRMAWCIGSLASIICLFLIVYRDDVDLKKRVYKLGILSVCFIEVALYFSLYGIYTSYNNNVEKNSMYVINYVDEWNANHEEKIEKIALYKDNNITESKWFSIVPYLTIRIYNIEDDFYTQIKMFSNNRFYYAESNDQIYNEYFKDKDWNEFDNEQFVVCGDTLHFCKY